MEKGVVHVQAEDHQQSRGDQQLAKKHRNLSHGPKRKTLCQHFDLRFLASKTERQVSVAKPSSSMSGNLSMQMQAPCYFTNPLRHLLPSPFSSRRNHVSENSFHSQG